MSSAVTKKTIDWGATTWLGIGALITGLALRLFAARGDPWLDEIWSWKIAREGNLFLPADNNHIINTIWLWLVQDVHTRLIWRLPAVIAGTGSILVVGQILSRLGRVHAVIAMWLMACSYPLMVYQSETRGYSVMLLCMLLAIKLALTHAEGDNSRTWPLKFCLVCIVGTLSHLAFLLFYGLMLIWMLLQRRWQRVLVEQWMTAVFMVIWWFVFISRMQYLGGHTAKWDVVLDDVTRSLTLLGPIALAGVIMVAAWMMYSRDRKLSSLLLVVVVLYPIGVICKSGGLLYLRYFLPAMIAVLMMLGGLLGEVWRRGYRTCAAALALLLMTIQVLDSRPILTMGRDHQQRVLADLSERSGNIGSRQFNQLSAIVEYYDATHGTKLQPRLCDIGNGPEWAIEMGPDLPATMKLGSAVYQVFSRSPGRSWSGIDWTIYRRLPQLTEGPQPKR